MPRPLAHLLILPALLAAGAAWHDPPRTTMDGVYTEAQAADGATVWREVCAACHLPGALATPAFRAKWYGRPLGELYGFIRQEMPKLDPGSLTADEYALVVAYLLRQQGMPAGTTPLPTDSLALVAIRFDSLPSVPRPGSPR